MGRLLRWGVPLIMVILGAWWLSGLETGLTWLDWFGGKDVRNGLFSLIGGTICLFFPRWIFAWMGGWWLGLSGLMIAGILPMQNPYGFPSPLVWANIIFAIGAVFFAAGLEKALRRP